MSEQPKIETSNIIPFERVLELQDQQDQELVQRMKRGIETLEKGKKRYEEWRAIALEQGDEQSAALYEYKALEHELLIIQGKLLEGEAEIESINRCQRHFDHEMNAERDAMHESLLQGMRDEIENIDSEVEFLSASLELSEEMDREKYMKMIGDLQTKRASLELTLNRYQQNTTDGQIGSDVEEKPE